MEEVEKIKADGEAAPQRRRQIIIETDGNNVFLIKAEVGGRIELVGVLSNLVAYLNSQNKK